MSSDPSDEFFQDLRIQEAVQHEMKSIIWASIGGMPWMLTLGASIAKSLWWLALLSALLMLTMQMVLFGRVAFALERMAKEKFHG